MINKISKRNIIALYSRLLYVSRAWKTNKKIVVIESDDWGSIRTSNIDSFKFFQKQGYNMHNSPYTYDCLESDDDLSALYDVLRSIKDSKANNLTMTANMIMANPNFDAIEKNNFQEYVYEPVRNTLSKYKHSSNVVSLWKEGMKDGFFFPQFHGREHIRFWEWLENLQNKEKETIETFKNNMCGLPIKVSKKNIGYFKAQYIDNKELQKYEVDLNEIISEGIELFKDEFDFYSLTTIAPNCGWTESAEDAWLKNKIKFIQGGFLQEHHYKNNIKYIPHYLGEIKQSNKMMYLVRNCSFEPCYSSSEEYWISTFKQVVRAFKFHTPAIISSHRINYIGSINQKNRNNGLSQLTKLMEAIKKSYPDVLFLNTLELANMIDE